VSLGGDSDTLACIAGSVAEAYYGVPAFIEQECLLRLDSELRSVVEEFRAKFIHTPK
jgi:ADP-ribosylglycohydrolase